ncbi:porin [Azospirillum sp. ST 5-10]|uniref:porin n=1 Tax=unclassified Azospirillum TaxID=2630922 RepID=UPI003F4A2127
MKKMLFAGTAVALLSAAAPLSAAEMVVTLGGFVDFQAGYFDNDTDDNDFDFANEVEVHINADGKADNGLEYGVHIELELRTAADGDGRSLRTDEASIYVGGTWGRVELGDNDGAIANMAVYAPTVGIGQLDGIGFKFSSGFFDAANAYPFFPTDLVSDSSKISYYSPDFAGFSFGVSYTPELNEGDATILSDPGTASDFLEGSVGYAGEFSGVSVAASAGIVKALDDGDVEDGDKAMWVAGLQLGYAGFTVGGGYVDFNEFNSGSGSYLFEGFWEHAWNVGARYETGPFGVAVQYAKLDGTSGSEEEAWSVGVAYEVAPGLSVGADYIWFEADAGTTGTVIEDDGNLVLFSTRMSF